MPYLLLSDGKLYDEPPESARLCRKFTDGSREFYLLWHGARLHRVSVYPLRSTVRRAKEERIAKEELDGSPEETRRIVAKYGFPAEWTVADYRPD